MKHRVITIAGYSCSGKSTIIHELEKIYNCEVIRFGMVHKECVRENGYAYAKDWIKEKGFESYERELIKCFARKIKEIKDFDGIIIIDGIFSSQCLSFMKGLKGLDLINIVLNTDYDVRVQRMMKRENLNFEDAVRHLDTTDGIKRRAGLTEIISQPSYVIDGNICVEKIKEQCLLIISQMSLDERSVPQKKYVNCGEDNKADR